jgi:hemolysin activation/secretion protein
VNSVLFAGARYYRRNLDKHLFLVSLDGLISNKLDPENQVLLGGDNGLRGYPLRYQSGESRALLTVEQRFYTEWYPWRLFRVGYAAFADVGRVWGQDPRGTPSLGTLSDVGFGLRLTSPRSSGRNIVHIDLAFPLNADPSIDNVQLLFETKGSF